MNELVKDIWLTNILEKESYRYQPDLNATDKADLSFLNNLRNDSFIYCKVPSNAVSLLDLLENNGFRVVDTNVVFEKKLAPNPVNSVENVRFAICEDEEAVVKIAENNFIYSRFHLDTKIADFKASQIKGEWVRNYFKKTRGDFLVVFQKNNELAGFCLLLDNKKNIVIDLICVDKKFHGCGIASDMIRFVEKKFLGYESLIVGTQVANIPSVRLYEKNGFKLQNSYYVLHRHTRQGDK